MISFAALDVNKAEWLGNIEKEDNTVYTVSARSEATLI